MIHKGLTGAIISDLSLEGIQGLLSGLTPEVGVGLSVVGLSMATMSAIKKKIKKQFRPLYTIGFSLFYGVLIGQFIYQNWKIGAIAGLIGGSGSMGVYDLFSHTIRKEK